MRKSRYTVLMLMLAASLSACGQSKPAETTAAETPAEKDNDIKNNE